MTGSGIDAESGGDVSVTCVTKKRKYDDQEKNVMIHEALDKDPCYGDPVGSDVNSNQRKFEFIGFSGGRTLTNRLACCAVVSGLCRS